MLYERIVLIQFIMNSEPGIFFGILASDQAKIRKLYFLRYALLNGQQRYVLFYCL